MKNGVFWDVTPCGSHGVTSQNTPFFIVTAAKTSNLTLKSQFENRKLCFRKVEYVQCMLWSWYVKPPSASCWRHLRGHNGRRGGNCFKRTNTSPIISASEMLLLSAVGTPAILIEPAVTLALNSHLPSVADGSAPKDSKIGFER
jgi:hypothetical protein